MADPIMEGEDFERRKQVAMKKIAEADGKIIPVILRKSRSARMKAYKKKKCLVPIDLTLGQFMYNLRQSISLPPEEAIFIFIDNCIPSSSAVMGELYEQYRKEDMCLYLTFTDENVYGCI